MSLEDELNRLIDDNLCSYGTSDIDAAMAMCQTLIDENPTAKVYLYTDTTYNTAPTVTIKNAAHTDGLEWNAGILGVRAVLDDYYYMYEVDLGYYEKVDNPMDVKSAILNVQLDVLNANAYSKEETDDAKNMKKAEATIRIVSGQTKTLVFKCGLDDTDNVEEDGNVVYFDLEEVYGKDVKIQTFGSAVVRVSRDAATNDANNLDDMFTIYGNQKNVIKVQYASTLPNTFMNGVMSSLKSLYKDRWDIQLYEVKKGDDFADKGYDLYIFEHEMPEILPSDGAILMVNPDKAPAAANFTVSQEVRGSKDYYLHT